MKTKRVRRTKAVTQEIRETIFELLSDYNPMTVRQVFYRLVSAGVIPKSENEYNNTVCRLLAEMRLAGELPWSWISDNTRWLHQPLTHASVEDAVDYAAQYYRRSLWDNQRQSVIVVTEKDALAGVMAEETRPYDVPLMVVRGFASLTYIHNVATMIRAAGKPTHVYYFGDHDPSGVHIDRNLERRLREFAPGIEIHFTRVAVRPEQVEEYGLPTRPTKTKKNPHAKGWQGDSVEVDALPANVLRGMVRRSIERHVDRRALEVVQAAERAERQQLQGLADALRRKAP